MRNIKKVFRSVLFSVIIMMLIDLPMYLSQDCRMLGQTCSDHGMCCGGCCFDGYCVQASRSCIMAVDLCMEHYCGPGFECFLYKPPDCMGCEEIADCRPFGINNNY